jgi:hypothetical protein
VGSTEAERGAAGERATSSSSNLEVGHGKRRECGKRRGRGKRLVMIDERPCRSRRDEKTYLGQSPTECARKGEGQGLSNETATFERGHNSEGETGEREKREGKGMS